MSHILAILKRDVGMQPEQMYTATADSGRAMVKAVSTLRERSQAVSGAEASHVAQDGA